MFSSKSFIVADLMFTFPASGSFHGPVTFWQIEGGKAEAVTDFLFLGSIITTDGDGSHEIRKTIASWQESRAEGLLFVHGLDRNPGSSFQTEEEAGLP